MKKEKYLISITPQEYDRMIKLVGGDASESYADIYFEAEDFYFAKNNCEIKIRERNKGYTLIFTTKTDNKVEEYKKEISVDDFGSIMLRGLPHDLLESFPLPWINCPASFKETTDIFYADVEESVIKLKSGLTLILREINCLRTPKCQIEFLADETELAFVKEYLKHSNIYWNPVKKYGYESLFDVWKSFFTGADAHDGEIMISFKTNELEMFEKSKVFHISIHTKAGETIRRVFMGQIRNEFGLDMIVWQEPITPAEKAKYVISNLKKGLDAIKKSDEFNKKNSIYPHDPKYKFYGITQIEYIAIKKAHTDFFRALSFIQENELIEIAIDYVVEGKTQKQIADKLKIKEKDVENRVKKLSTKLANEYKNIAKAVSGEFPPFEKLHPIHKDFIESAFNIYAEIGEEKFNALEMKGANRWWDLKTKTSLGKDEEHNKLRSLHEELFGDYEED